MESFVVTFNDKSIKCFIQRKKVKNINIRIKSEGIYISASKSISKEYIKNLINKKEQFIVNALKKINQESLKDSERQNIKKVSYLGNIYPVKIIPDISEQVVFDEKEFKICTSTFNADSIRILLKKWYLSKAMIIFREINEYTYNEFLKKGFKVPCALVTIKEMKTRWGSCNAVRGKISMNLRLMEYPSECIYGVFFHEYAHFIHQNHSKAFYDTLVSVYPDYYRSYKILKEYKI
ncbi:M48 family metallopeptidase [Porcipelethomonas sp.]|uniref:M48 family metallopeptidase n=1 Tax=Porcipelethomonas sp. TaxID=2981675 RepID=UPI003EFA99E2